MPIFAGILIIMTIMKTILGSSQIDVKIINMHFLYLFSI